MCFLSNLHSTNHFVQQCNTRVILTCPWHAPDMPLTRPWHAPDTPLTRPWHAPDTPLTCPWHAPDTTLTCPWHGADTFQKCMTQINIASISPHNNSQELFPVSKLRYYLHYPSHLCWFQCVPICGHWLIPTLPFDFSTSENLWETCWNLHYAIQPSNGQLYQNKDIASCHPFSLWTCTCNKMYSKMLSFSV